MEHESLGGMNEAVFVFNKLDFLKQDVSFFEQFEHGFNKPFKKQIWMHILVSMILYDYKYQTKVEPIPFFPPKKVEV